MTLSAKKITDLIKTQQFSYSFEVTPDVSMENVMELKVDPLFYSVTWHAKIHMCENLDIAPIKLAVDLKNKGKNVLLHLTCDLLRIAYLDGLLKKLRENGICNLFLILGESHDTNASDFQCSKDLIKYIREQSGDYFCIGVAGFPGRSDNRFKPLKEKIDCGADFIITQAFFEANSFRKYVDECIRNGITVPVLPGLFLYNTFQELNGFINKCKVKVSDDFIKMSKDDISMASHGHETIRTIISEIKKDEFNISHFHFFTLNKLNKVSMFVNSCIDF